MLCRGVAPIFVDDLTPFQINSRVLIDFHGYAKHYLGLQRIEKPSKNEDIDWSEDDPYRSEKPPKNEDHSSSEDGAYIKPLSDQQQEANKNAMLKRKGDLIFVSPMLWGFAMGDKEWRTWL